MRFFSHAAGRGISRRQVWFELKRLCKAAGGSRARCSPTTCGTCSPPPSTGPSETSCALPGYAGSFQHRHHPHLPDGQRDGAAAAAGSLGACFVGNRISILLIGRRPIFKKHPKSREFFWIKSVFLAARCKKPGPQKPKTLWVFLPCQSLQ